MEGVKSRPFILALGAADAIISINVDDPPAGPLGNLAQLALLVGGCLVPQIENCPLHRILPLTEKRGCWQNQPFLPTTFHGAKTLIFQLAAKPIFGRYSVQRRVTADGARQTRQRRTSPDDLRMSVLRQ